MLNFICGVVRGCTRIGTPLWNFRRVVTKPVKITTHMLTCKGPGYQIGCSSVIEWCSNPGYHTECIFTYIYLWSRLYHRSDHEAVITCRTDTKYMYIRVCVCVYSCLHHSHAMLCDPGQVTLITRRGATPNPPTQPPNPKEQTPGKYGTHTTVKATSWPWLSDKIPFLKTLAFR